MIKKVTEIFKAWNISFNPNQQQSELAAERIQVCDSCEFKETTPVIHCSVCGCALRGKIYSPNKGACPKGKWNDIDEKFL